MSQSRLPPASEATADDMRNKLMKIPKCMLVVNFSVILQEICDAFPDRTLAEELGIVRCTLVSTLGYNEVDCLTEVTS